MIVDWSVEGVRQSGLPIYAFTYSDKQELLVRLLRYDRANMLKDGLIGQTMHGLALAWNYFPHAWNVRCGSMKTPTEVFDDDELLAEALSRREDIGPACTLSDLRKALRTFSGAQAVSNFRPTAAAAIYDRYLPAWGGAVWDMSAGFGGRLLGALSCRRVTRYVATDPSTATMDGLNDMRDELLSLMRELGLEPPEVELHRIGSEDFQPEPESLDLCFTSPPYFDRERYSQEETQSFIRFPSPEGWLYGYLRATLRNCWTGLVTGGHLVINIANVKTFPDLTDRFQQLALDEGWTPLETLHLALSKMVGTRRTGETHKFEPVFVFRKP